MAKGKHSAALFEVIKNSKQPERAAQSLRTPKWWFKSGQAVQPQPAAVETPSFDEADSAVMVAAPPAAAPAPRPSVPRQTHHESGRSSAVHLDFDKHRQEITLRLRYTTAIVTAFGVCVLIGMAYVIGRHISRGPQTAIAAPIAAPQSGVQQLMTRPPQQGVTDLPRPRNPRPVSADPSQAKRTADPANTPAPRPPQPASLVPAGAETRMPRTIGLNYAIIQTYPGEEKASAEAAREFLTSNGIPCTIESTDYVRNPNWVCLVGTAGFTKISSGDYKTYVDNIIKLGEKFPTSHFDRFKPAAYKWKG